MTQTIWPPTLPARRRQTRRRTDLPFEHVGRNQRGELVCRAERNLMMRTLAQPA